MRSVRNNAIIRYKELRVSYTQLVEKTTADNTSIKLLYKRLMSNKLAKPSLTVTRKKRIRWKDRSKSERFSAKRERKLHKHLLMQRLYNVVKVAKVFVNITSNNTHVTITSLDNNSIKRSIVCSAGCIAGIKGTKRSTPIATDMVVKRALYRLKKTNKQARILHLYRSGAGRGRSVVRKALMASRRKIHMIREVTAIPHNGTRKQSRRRV